MHYLSKRLSIFTTDPGRKFTMDASALEIMKKNLDATNLDGSSVNTPPSCIRVHYL